MEDYYQEMLIRLWKAFPGFRGESAFSTWLYRVALNTAIDIVRKKHILPKYISLSKKEFNIPGENESSRYEEKEKLYNAISRLSVVEKAIILLYLEGYEYREIAEISGITETNTGVKINRIKEKLNQMLNNGEI